MSDQIPEGAAGAPAAVEAPAANEDPQSSNEAGTEAPAASTEDPFAGLPEEFSWMKKELESTRSEAGKYRILAREREEKLAAAKTPEEFEAAVAAGAAATAALETELARERAIRTHGLSEAAAVLLKNTPADEVEAVAAALAGMIQPVKQVVVTEPPLQSGMSNETAVPEKSGRALWAERKKR